MPPYTKLPRPEGHIYISYSPMSPPNWGIVSPRCHYFVYRDVKVAMQAMLQAVTTIHAQRLEAGGASLFSDHVYFRGQPDISHRLLPTRLRVQQGDVTARQRYAVNGGPPGQDPREHFGDWFEEIKPWRVNEKLAEQLPPVELDRRDAKEREALGRAAKVDGIAILDDFRKRAAVRHYSGAPSSLLDVSTNPEVAAFFATGGGSRPPPAGRIGMLWAIDLNFFDGLFSLEVTGVPGGLSIKAREQRESWGDNAKMFQDHGILPVCPDLTSVALPFRRPQAQSARFFSLSGEGGRPLPALTELTWWSIIERRACGCAFIQDGSTYENPGHNITSAALLPDDEELACTLAQAG